jgi:outer membrane protein OmpA-like peptidoglycan-associated protein
VNPIRFEAVRDRRHTSRTSWVRALVAGASFVVLLAGCQSPGPVPRTEQVQALRSLGFAQTDEGWTLNLAVPILFDVGSDGLKQGPKREIAEMAKQLRHVGIERIRIEGHTDNLGTRGYNVELSRRRAEVVAREFVANGFPDATIERKAWGFEHPVASNDTPEGRALNRRVAIVVVAAGPAAD